MYLTSGFSNGWRVLCSSSCVDSWNTVVECIRLDQSTDLSSFNCGTKLTNRESMRQGGFGKNNLVSRLKERTARSFSLRKYTRAVDFDGYCNMERHLEHNLGWLDRIPAFLSKCLIRSLHAQTWQPQYSWKLYLLSLSRVKRVVVESLYWIASWLTQPSLQ